MRITFITNSLGIGGSEKMIKFVANGLSNLGHNVSIINLNTTGDLSNAENNEYIKVFNANILYKNTFITNFHYLKFVLANVKKTRPEVLIGFLFLGNFFSVIVGKILRIPSIISERSNPFFENKNLSIFTKIKLHFINKANGAVFQTKGASLFYQTSLQKNCCIIANPISLPLDFKCNDIHTKRNTIVSLGRLDNKQKRVDITLKAFAKFHKLHKDYKLLIYGSGPDELYLKQLTDELKLSESVFFKGISREPLKDLNNGKIFIITSEYEGISNTLLEAMALGLAVVSTDHSPGGASLLIQNRKNGLLTPVNDIDAIAKALEEYADNERLVKTCSLEAKNVLNLFKPNHIINLWEEYILFIKKKYNE